MTHTQDLIKELKDGLLKDKLKDIYIDNGRLEYQTGRYIGLLEEYERVFGAGEAELYSAPGRSEIGGNHTDHQNGEVIAAAISCDAIAAAGRLSGPVVKVVSDGAAMVTVELDNLEKLDSEEGTTVSLVKGMLAGLRKHGYTLGGFQAYVTSDVLVGAGLSSSAAFETMIGTIVSGLYNSLAIPAVEIAVIGQYAENEYFGKPCGLMDQMACSVGGLIHIDFANPAEPAVEKLQFNLEAHGYSLCITDTKGSHADLTADYAAVPAEMKKAAAVFGKAVLRDVGREELFSQLAVVREKAGDRAALRAIHFVQENERVRRQAQALQADDIQNFLKIVKASGDSSFKYLQNVYTNHDVRHQNVSVALAVSDNILGDGGVSRVHGGGFAGTIQAFVRDEMVAEYKRGMEAVFGEGTCSVLKIRRYGGMRVR